MEGKLGLMASRTHLGAQLPGAAPVDAWLGGELVLCPQDPRVVVSTLMKLAGGSPSLSKELNVDAFLDQASLLHTLYACEAALFVPASGLLHPQGVQQVQVFGFLWTHDLTTCAPVREASSCWWDSSCLLLQGLNSLPSSRILTSVPPV